MWVLLLLLLVPVAEIAVFIQVGGLIGLWPTLALTILTAVAGAWLMRAQGFAALRRLRSVMEEGGDPRGPLAEGALVLLAGALMLTPGFLTDAAGLLLLAPPVRAALIAVAGARFARAAAGPRSGARPASPGVIDAEYEEVEPSAPRAEPSRWTRPPE